MGDNFWEATQAILQGNPPMVVKPKLTESLLKKPPFRFLHDVISQVQTNKKFAQGLFSGDELDSGSIKDKAAKVSYLTKIIDVVGIASGKFVPAKPLKVVAGHEPELTNQFLQMLGELANTADAADAVQRVLAGEHQAEGGAAKSTAPPPQPPTTQAPPPASEPEPETAMPPSNIGISEPTTPKDETAREHPRAEDKPKKERHPSRSDATKAEKPPTKPAPEPEPEPEPERQEVVRASGGAPQRPQSARRGPPKPVVKDAPKEKLSGGMAPPGAAGRPPTGASAPVRGIMVDGDDGDDDDDDEQLVVQSDKGGMESFTAKGNEGKLVRDILDTKDELNKGRMQEEEQREEKETGIILGRGRKKGTDTVKKEEIQRLRESIQMLCQTTNPLSKCMDQLQEDMENMHKELNFWSSERTSYAASLREQQKITQEQMNKMSTQLHDIEDEILHAKERTGSLKAQILRNDDIIERLLSNVVQGSGRG